MHMKRRNPSLSIYYLRLLLGVLRSKHVDPIRQMIATFCIFCKIVRGSFKLSIGGGPSYPGAAMPQVTLYLLRNEP